MRALPAGLVVLILSQCVHAAEPLDFRRDVQPILSNHCWNCHGKDDKTRKAGLRLDSFEAATRKDKGHDVALIPGKPDDSPLLQRVRSADATEVMPPPSFKKPLSDSQKEILRRWIAEGGKYAKHWAFEPPQRPEIPKPIGDAKSPIDAFIRARLDKEGLSPAPEADRSTWLRRVTFDLTGLPPTPEERAAFLADTTPQAYEKVVDRLLASPAHAERMAMHWLDLARYADTNGYNNDEIRTMWPWRDWVIDAFARNLPYDQFLAEQLAGDLLPKPTLPQIVATGFNRNHVLTTEGGIIEEEYRAEYVADRVHTTTTVFMALSVQCARCHDHKYDPISQRDFYQLAAFFNNIPEGIVGYGKGIRMSEPLVKVPNPEQIAKRAGLEQRKTTLEAALAKRVAESAKAARQWANGLKPDEIEKLPNATLAAHFPFDDVSGKPVVNAIRPDMKTKLHGTSKHSPGKVGGAFDFDGKTRLEAGNIADFEGDQPFSIAVWIKPSSVANTAIVSKMAGDGSYRGYDLLVENGKLTTHVVHHWPDGGFKVASKNALKADVWQHVTMSYDGSRKPEGVQFFVDGKRLEHATLSAKAFTATIRTDAPFAVGSRLNSNNFAGSLDDLRVFSTKLSPDDVAAIVAGKPVAGIREAIRAGDARSPEQTAIIERHYIEAVDPEARKLREELAAIPKQVTTLDAEIPSTMVMREMPQRRKTHLLIRGEYDKKGPEMSPAVPTQLAPFPADFPVSRLGLARWLTSPNHPLTARVAVNRWWEMLFGMGLVETSEDFGVQGAQPSHPELLDWLATELIRSGWDTRGMLKQMVLSGTYRQSSNATAEQRKADPQNRLLARMSRYRLPAETVRDAALAHAGLLVRKVGGPSVKPYQPDGLWEDVSVERRDSYKADTGEGLYRRSFYTFWKRTCPPPGMMNFDAPDRETCVVRRARTNTPLQALSLLNDPTYVEAARKLAERMIAAGPAEKDRIGFASNLVLSRNATEPETAVFLDMYQSARAKFDKDPAAADKLLKVGHSPRDVKLPAAELAAWTVVASLVLNLDEAITRP